MDYWAQKGNFKDRGNDSFCTKYCSSRKFLSFQENFVRMNDQKGNPGKGYEREITSIELLANWRRKRSKIKKNRFLCICTDHISIGFLDKNINNPLYQSAALL